MIMIIGCKAKNNLKEGRFFAKKSQAQLWIETGIHYSTISRIECGFITPTEQQKAKLARALKVEVGWLFPAPEGGRISNQEESREKR